MFTLAIDDVVEVPVKFTLKSGRVAKLFAFTLVCTRLPTQESISLRLEEKEHKYKEFMSDLITDWIGQRLVLDAEGAPVAFGPEALELMLGAPGVAKNCFEAYVKEVGAQAKN